MVNFLSNLEAYKLVDEYYITTPEPALITIRVLQAFCGGQDFSYKAFPYFPKLDECSEQKYHGFGATPEDALQNCLKAINGVSLLSMMMPVALKQTALQNKFGS